MVKFVQISDYHEDFVTPGISPLLAISLKHILHKPKSLIYPLLLPQRKQRRTTRLLNLGGFCALKICDVLAMLEIVNEERSDEFTSSYTPFFFTFL